MEKLKLRDSTLKSLEKEIRDEGKIFRIFLDNGEVKTSVTQGRGEDFFPYNLYEDQTNAKGKPALSILTGYPYNWVIRKDIDLQFLKPLLKGKRIIVFERGSNIKGILSEQWMGRDLGLVLDSVESREISAILEVWEQIYLQEFSC